VIDRSSGVALYRLVADHLQERIRSGEWRPGYPIPSMNEIADEYEINRHTARRAVQVLANRSLVTIRHGDATRVRETPTVSVVDVPPGHRVTARMPTDREKVDLDLPDGVPMLVLLGPADAAGVEWIEVDVWPADRTHLQVSE
jgi:DNA-binding transcriptional MocR family regulator